MKFHDRMIHCSHCDSADVGFVWSNVQRVTQGRNEPNDKGIDMPYRIDLNFALRCRDCGLLVEYTGEFRAYHCSSEIIVNPEED